MTTNGGLSSPAAVEKPRYRYEIQGLRAVAALLVATFHIWLGRVSGGVDVFFVVSGFFITMTLFGHFDRFGAIRPLTYVSRLLRRLLPAALLVLIVVFIGTLLLLPQGQWGNTFGEIVASALYFENWQLAFNSVDYLAAAQEHTAVQHFWAMSIQGQFYLIWLAIFLAVAFILKKKGLATARTVALYFFIGVFVLSFAYSVWFTVVNQPFAYFSTFTRAWEFSLGGIAAVLLPRIRVGTVAKVIMSWVGLFGVISCGLILQVSTVFPGYAALWPALSALLILFGGGSGVRFSADTLLSTKFMVWLGGLSYGIYLWHWPILVFVRDAMHRESDVGKAGFLVLGLAILAAWLTKVLIEKPIQNFERKRSVNGPKIVMAALAGVVAIVVIAGTVSIASIRAQFEADQKLVAQLEADPSACFGARALDPEITDCDDTGFESVIVPEGAPNLDVPEAYTDECRTNTEEDEVKECVFGEKGADTRVALIGNSHSVSWLPAFTAIAKQQGWELHVFFKGACVFNTEVRADSNPEIPASCARWNTALQAELASQSPYDLLLTSHKAPGFWPDAEGNQDLERASAGFRAAWQPLIDRGTKIIAIRDTPKITDEVLDCVDVNGLDSNEKCPVKRSDALTEKDPIVMAATDYPGAYLIDMTDFFCGEEKCYTVVGHVKIFRDFHHFTASYSNTLAPYLFKAMEKAGVMSDYDYDEGEFDLDEEDQTGPTG